MPVVFVMCYLVAALVILCIRIVCLIFFSLFLVGTSNKLLNRLKIMYLVW